VRYRFYLRYVCCINFSPYRRCVHNRGHTKIFRIYCSVCMCVYWLRIKWWYSRSLSDAHPLSVWHCPPEFRLLSLRRWRQEVLRNRDKCLPNYVGPQTPGELPVSCYVAAKYKIFLPTATRVPHFRFSQRCRWKLKSLQDVTPYGRARNSEDEGTTILRNASNRHGATSHLSSFGWWIFLRLSNDVCE